MIPRRLLAVTAVFAIILTVPVYAQPAGGKKGQRGAVQLPTFRTPQGRVFKLGCLPTPKSVLARYRQVPRLTRRGVRLPIAVDLSNQMPPVGDQGSQGSCTAWATTYYYKTYQEGQEQGWDLSDFSHRYSPAWTYNQINSGFDGGSWPGDAMELGVVGLKRFIPRRGALRFWRL